MTKFDRILWRMNGLLLLSFVILAILVGSYTAIKIYKAETRTRHVSDMVKVEGHEEDKVDYILGRFSPVYGTSYYMAPLYREDSYSQSYYSKSSSSEVNYLFFNSKTKESRWLLKDKSHLIVHKERIFKDPTEARRDLSPIASFFFFIVEEDSDKDGRLTRKDEVHVIFSDVSGDSKVILEDVSFLGFNQEDQAHSLLFLEREDKVEAVKLDNLRGNIISSTSIELD